MPSTPYVITQPQARELLAHVDVPQILRKQFRRTRRGVVENQLDMPVLRTVEKTPNKRCSVRIT